MELSDFHVKLFQQCVEYKMVSSAKSILYIGSNIISDYSILQEFFHKNEIHNRPDTVEDFWNELGFEKVTVIEHDVSLEDDDRNFNILESSEQYDVVFNSGDSMHCFDQVAFFRFMHNSVSLNGHMISVGCWHNGTDKFLYNYQPNFFAKIMGANQYNCHGTYFSPLSRPADEHLFFQKIELGFEYSKMKYLDETGATSIDIPWYIGVLMQKVNDEEFRPYV